MSDWKPIKSAPKDGTPVIICVDGDTVGEAYWYNYSDNQEDQGWWWAQTGPGDYHSSKVVINGPFKAYWMPLPSPPK